MTTSRNWVWKLFLAICWMIGSAAVWANCASAQITPDGTLPTNSNVRQQGNTFNITGGTPTGSNLFHSFGEFSVPAGGTAYFNNGVNIQNIISRVTGGSVSNINGLIRANGGANLFLINPAGIIFGRGARLDVGGSFAATTANAIGFGNLGFFSATNPESPSPLLTINPSALLFNQIQSRASIQNNSVAPAGTDLAGLRAFGLRVPDGKSLLLVGGDIQMNGGRLNAFGGRVELGGLAGVGTVGLNGDGNNLSLSFPDGVERSDVSLSNGAEVRVTASNGGSIAVNARNLDMTGSFLFAGIETELGSDNSQAGNIEVNATGVINLNNRSSIANQVLPEASGQGGDVSIRASKLQVEGGSRVEADTYGKGKGGSLTVDAIDVQVIGRSANGEFGSRLGASAQPNSTGDAGDLTIKTNTLLIKDGAFVSAATWGQGKGGNLTIDAIDVRVIGTSADGEFPSRLGASAQPGSTKDAGNLTIKTNTLLVQNGAQVSAGTRGEGKGGNLTIDAIDVQVIGDSADGRLASGLFVSTQPDPTRDTGQPDLTGDAGNLTIKTNTLLVQNGAQVSAGTFGQGKGGNLIIDAQDIQLIGTSPDGGVAGLFASAEEKSTGDAGDLTMKTNTLLVRDGAQVFTGTRGEGNGGNLTVDAQNVQLIGTSPDGKFESGLLASAQPDSTVNAGDLTIGNAGDLTITTNTLLIQDGAGLTVQSLGTGTAGNMTVNARSIRLNNGILLADTQSAKVDPTKEQATININSQNLIMRRGSNITANARGENVIGGNININAPQGFIVAAKNENSDISANSANFRGGRITINAQGIYGIQFRPAPTRFSDITATGGTPNLTGTVTINTPDIDLTRGLINLPAEPGEPQLAAGCASPSTNASSFVVTGRGGLPDNPRESFEGNTPQVGWVTLNQGSGNNNNPKVSDSSPQPTPSPIVEATSWRINDKGEVILIADASAATSGSSSHPVSDCSATKP